MGYEQKGGRRKYGGWRIKRMFRGKGRGEEEGKRRGGEERGNIMG